MRTRREDGHLELQGGCRACGPAGGPDYSLVYDKAAADGRFLQKTGKAADADKVDGIDGKGLARGKITTQSIAVDTPAGSSATLLALPGWATVSVLNCNASVANSGILNQRDGATSFWVELGTLPAGSSAGTNWTSGGSSSTPSGWVRWTLAKPSVGTLVVDVRSRWSGVGCSFALMATYPTS